jgi:hypothetical protein
MLLETGQLLSNAGTSSTSIAYPLLVLAVTHSPAKAGIVEFARTFSWADGAEPRRAPRAAGRPSVRRAGSDVTRRLLDPESELGLCLKGLRSPSMPEPLDFALIKRLREVLDRRPATETELRTLKEQAEGWQRAVSGQLEASERRLRRLNANPASSLAQIASELRRVEKLRPQLDEVGSLLGDLENRARELRTEWLLSQATSAKASSRRPGDRRP